MKNHKFDEFSRTRCYDAPSVGNTGGGKRLRGQTPPCAKRRRVFHICHSVPYNDGVTGYPFIRLYETPDFIKMKRFLEAPSPIHLRRDFSQSAFSLVPTIPLRTSELPSQPRDSFNQCT